MDAPCPPNVGSIRVQLACHVRGTRVRARKPMNPKRGMILGEEASDFLRAEISFAGEDGGIEITVVESATKAQKAETSPIDLKA